MASGPAGDPVPLGTAGNFAVLAGAGITNTGATTINNGDVGSSSTPTETGFETVTINNGANHTDPTPNDEFTVGAKVALDAAITDATGRGTTSPIVANLGGQLLTPGVYNSASSIGLTGTLTLDAQGDPDAVFIFQAGSTLTTAGTVSLINGAQSCNVFWVVGSSATLGTGTQFAGTILAVTSITLVTGSTINGRLLARDGAITLDTNTITVEACSVAATTTTSEATTTTSEATTTEVAAVETTTETTIEEVTTTETTVVEVAAEENTSAETTVAAIATTAAVSAKTTVTDEHLPKTGTTPWFAFAGIALILIGAIVWITRKVYQKEVKHKAQHLILRKKL